VDNMSISSFPSGREIQFDITTPSTAAAFEARLGRSSVFPRLEVVKQLESAFLRDPHTPSDVQVLLPFE